MSISLPIINSSSPYDTKQTFFNPACRASLADRYPQQPEIRDSRHDINLLDLYAGCSTPGQVRKVFKRTLREGLTKGPGLSYNQASDLTSIIFGTDKTFDLRGVNGFWDNETTARNMTFVALDKLPELQDVREMYLFLCEVRDSGIPLSHEDRAALNVAIRKMKMIMQEEILGKDGGREFLCSNGLGGLVVHKRTFLDKFGSLGSILRAFLPGVIDESNPHALIPHKVEHEWWDDRDYAKRQVVKALHSVPGLSTHLETYERLDVVKQLRSLTKREQREFAVALDNISDILRKEVLDKGGGQKFLDDRGLSGLVGYKRTFLDKFDSFGSVLRAFLPGVIDENNPLALKPHEVEDCWWDDRDYARRQVLKVLHSVPGLSPHLEVYERLSGTKQSRPLIENEQVELDNAIRDISDFLRKEVLDKGGGQKFLYSNGLRGLVGRKRTFLDKKSCFGSVLRAFLPGVIDENNPLALKPHEVEDCWWDDRDYARRQVLKVLHSVPGLSPHLEVYERLSGTKQSRPLIENEQVELDNAIRDISDILRKEVLDKGGGQKFLYDRGLKGLVSCKRTFLDKFDSFGSVLRAFLPEAAQRLMEN